MHVVTAVKALQIDQIAALRRPKPQRVDGLAAPADHGRVIGYGQNPLAALPNMLAGAVGRARFSDMAAKADGVDRFSPLKLPRIAKGEPIFRLFDLPAIGQALLKQTMLIADTVAKAGNALAGHAFHKTGSQPP